ncbi:MAG TPA: hypothetical protein VFE53_06455 [Mucilaginibacter sp.]|jgi:hypothetical protein|nr:hypothetical protein [Mucilaginibacter sp.]
MIYGNTKMFKHDSNKEIRMNRKGIPERDPLEVGKKDAIVERTKAKTKQTEDLAYKSKMKKDYKY